MDSRLFFVPRIYDDRSFVRSFRDGDVIFDLGTIFGAAAPFILSLCGRRRSVMNDPLYSAIRESISVAKMRNGGGGGGGRAGHQSNRRDAAPPPRGGPTDRLPILRFGHHFLHPF